MKKSFFLSIFAVFFTLFGFSQSLEDVFSVITFEESVKSLNWKVQNQPSAIEDDKWIVLVGGVASVTVVDRNPESYTVVVELVDGEWVTEDNVELFTCYLEFRGEEFIPVFPARRPRNPAESYVDINQEILVGARFLGVNGDNIPWLEGGFLKKLP